MPYKKLLFRVHALQRMLQRNISEEAVRNILSTGKAIENYPKDEPYPSYLMLGQEINRTLHVVAADSAEDEMSIVITVYEPDPKQWDEKFEKRKK